MLLCSLPIWKHLCVNWTYFGVRLLRASGYYRVFTTNYEYKVREANTLPLLRNGNEMTEINVAFVFIKGSNGNLYCKNNWFYYTLHEMYWRVCMTDTIEYNYYRIAFLTLCLVYGKIYLLIWKIALINGFISYKLDSLYSFLYQYEIWITEYSNRVFWS